ncbi:hypothetical protein HDU67_009588 [Dinochytrium kinnereticum]|nr:hypothetical protein HDU67_009588 [Dinochytrium kinnereticum]
MLLDGGSLAANDEAAKDFTWMIAVLAYSYWRNMRKKNDHEELLPFDRRSPTTPSSLGGNRSSIPPSSLSVLPFSIPEGATSSQNSPILVESGDLGSRLSAPLGSRSSPSSSSPSSGHVLMNGDLARSTSAAGDLSSVGSLNASSSDIFIRERVPRSTFKKLGSNPNAGDSGDSIALLNHVEDGSPRDNDEDTDELTDYESTAKEKPKLTRWTMIKLNAFWFGYQVYWFLIAIVIVPKQIEEIMGDENKGKGLSFISLIAGGMTLFLAVFLGAMNDRFASRYGRRRPWMIIGALMMCLSLMLLSGESTLTMYTVGYLLMTCSTVVASVPFNGLLADVTPPEQKGAVSAIMGFLNLSGYLMGAIIGMFGGTPNPGSHLDTSGLYAIMSSLVLLSAAITVLSTRESSSLHLKHTLKPISWGPFLVDMIRPLYTNSDFRLVFISRFLFQLGIATVQQFLQ